MQNYAACCINLTDSERSVQLFKIDAFTATKQKSGSIASTRTSVGGYDWVINYHPTAFHSNEYWIMFRITLDSVAREVVASFACRLVDPTGHLEPFSPVPAAVSAKFCKGHSEDFFVATRNKLVTCSSYLKDDSILVECVITVLLDNRPTRQDQAAASLAPTTTSAAAPAPPSDLHRQFGELWRSQKGTDVTFLVSGEPIAAHKCVLAARSPVFMAELFGDMKEKASRRVEIEDMAPEVFRALMQFVYTDTAPPELEGDARMMMAQHLLAAADRYGMERLKTICEEKMCADISVDTVSTALALAEQHGCSELKARCIKFIVATPANL